MSCPVGMLLVSAVRVTPTLRSLAGRAARCAQGGSATRRCARLVQDLEDSVAPNTWRAYRSDLADFATWVAYTGADWRAPEVVAKPAIPASVSPPRRVVAARNAWSSYDVNIEDIEDGIIVAGASKAALLRKGQGASVG